MSVLKRECARARADHVPIGKRAPHLSKLCTEFAERNKFVENDVEVEDAK